MMMLVLMMIINSLVTATSFESMVDETGASYVAIVYEDVVDETNAYTEKISGSDLGDS